MVTVTVGDSVFGPMVPLGTLPIPKTENLTEAFLREHYIGYKANIVEKELSQDKGKRGCLLRSDYRKNETKQLLLCTGFNLGSKNGRRSHEKKFSKSSSSVY